MTSKNLFFNLLIEDLKNRVWSAFLAVFAFFIALPVVFLMSYQHSSLLTLSEIRNTIGLSNPFLPVITVVGAVICALGGFSYLHSRTKTDHWHSLPVRRELLFAVKYINGLLIYLGAFLLNIGITLLLFAVNHLLTADVFTEVYMCILVHTTAYWLFYSIALVTVFLTGHLLVNLMGTFVFFLYGICVGFLALNMRMTFLSTAYDNGGDYFTYTGGAWSSPINAYVRLVDEPQTMFVLWIAALLFSALALLLYRKRPSEAAGRSMAFPNTAPLFKVLLLVPLALGGGMFFRTLSGYSPHAWFLFGMALTWFAGSVFIEVIFAFDFRQAFCHKGSSLACLALAFCIFTIFRLDLFGYDTYLPNQNSVESMAFYTSDLDSGISTLEPRENDAFSYRYVSNSEYRLKHMELTDFETAYQMAKTGVEEARLQRKFLRETGESLHMAAPETSSPFSFTVKYHLKNGRDIYRKYSIPLSITGENSKYYETLARIYADPAYKLGSYPILLEKDPENIFTSVSFYDTAYDSRSLSLTSEQRQALMDAFRKEMLSTTLPDTIQNRCLGRITFTNDRYSSAQFGDYPIYSSNLKTLTLLKEFGFEDIDEFPKREIQKLQIREETTSEGIIPKTAAADELLNPSTGALVYTEASDINALTPCLRPLDGNTYFYQAHYGQTLYFATAYFGTQDAAEFLLDIEKAPSFLKEALGL